jgi:hypothetical protein
VSFRALEALQTVQQDAAASQVVVRAPAWSALQGWHMARGTLRSRTSAISAVRWSARSIGRSRATDFRGGHIGGDDSSMDCGTVVRDANAPCFSVDSAACTLVVEHVTGCE